MRRYLLVALLLTCGSFSAPCQNATREWRKIDKTAYYGRIPDAAEISRWKRQFELANPIKEIDESVLAGFKDMNQCVAVLDLTGTALDEKRFGHRDERTLWRLLQYDPDYDNMPREGYARIKHISSQIDKLLDYQPASNSEHSNQLALRISLKELYLNILQKEVFKRCRPELQKAFQEEGRQWEQYHKHCLDCYSIVIGGPESFRGNSWERALGYYELSDFDMVIPSYESLLRELMGEGPDTLDTPTWDAVSLEAVMKAFDSFPVRQDEYSFPLPKQRNALADEKNAWCSWLDSRIRVSGLLPGREREVYDAETKRLLRFKYVMLKNGLMLDNDYCLPSDKDKLMVLP